MDLFGRAVRGARATIRSGGQWGDSSIPLNSQAFPVGSTPASTNEAGLLSVAAAMNCVKVLHNDMGILPFHAYTGDKLGVKAAVSDPPLIVAEPFGPDLPVQAGFGQITSSLALRGRAFLFVADTEGGFPTQLQILHPDSVGVFRNNDGQKRFRINGMVFDPSEVKHITGLMLPGSIDGVDPVSYQRVTFALAQAVNEYGYKFFVNGTTPSGVISSPESADREKAIAIKEAWEAGNAGMANAHRPAVLMGGASFAPLAITPENAQFLLTKAFMREEICGWFGVPLQRIQAIVQHASQGGGKGLDTIDQGYATHTLLPIATQIERIWDAMLPGGNRTWTKFNFEGLLRASTLERAQIAQIHRLTGVRNRDEIRADEGWSPIGGPDGTNYNIPFNTNTDVPPLIEPGVDDPSDDPTGVQP